MAKKETDAKLGDRVKIVVKRRAKKPLRRPLIDDRRYGPPPFPEEVPRRRKRKAEVVVTFIDQQAFLNQVSPEFSPPRRELRWHVRYIPGDQELEHSLLAGTDVLRFSSPTESIAYRASYDRMAIAYDKAEEYGLSFVFNGVSYPLVAATPQWIERKSPTERRQALIDFDAENGTDHSPEIALLDFEVQEWAAAYESLETYWNPTNLDYGLNYATFETRLSSNSDFAVISSGIGFESFDPFDTTNYKVTQGAFADEEVGVEKLRARVRRAKLYDLRIGLLPQRWEFTLDYLAWVYEATVAADDQIIKRVRSASGSIEAITAPLVYTSPDFLGEPNKLIHHADDLPTGVLGSITHIPGSTTLTGLPAEANHYFFRLENDIDPLGLQPIAADDFDFQFDNPPHARMLIERSDAEITIVQADSQAEKLVGLFSIDGENFKVYRKTTLARGGAVYSGAFDAISTLVTRSEAGVFTFPYNRMAFTSESRDFAYFDPGALLDHVTV